MSWFGFSERIDKIRYEVFFHGTFSYDFFFVFDDDFVVGNFGDFGARNDELWI